MSQMCGIVATAVVVTPLHPTGRIGNKWGYWKDKNQTQPLTGEEVSRFPEIARAGHPEHTRFFTTHGWDLEHCVLCWRKMWESARCARRISGSCIGDGEGGMLMEKRYDRLIHIHHYHEMFLKRDSLAAIAAESGVASLTP